MVSGSSPDELPPGWKEHVKVSNGRKIKVVKSFLLVVYLKFFYGFEVVF